MRAPTSIDRAVEVIQASYPQIYLACHTRHQRKRSTAHRLSPRDSTILVHLSTESPTAPSRLALHLGVARSTMSEALKRLVSLGYVRAGGGGRLAGVVLTAAGARAVRATSVLEEGALRAVLGTLSADDLRLVTAGLARLATACRAAPSRARSAEAST
jgi:DNA-binding MarR family transcriptional regulator